MRVKFLLFIFFIFNIYLINTELVEKFKFIDVEFPNDELYSRYKSLNYSRNMALAGIKLDQQNNIYSSFPRWKKNIPITLGKFNNITKKFVPFPKYIFFKKIKVGNGMIWKIPTLRNVYKF
jgi:hypothetical protein